MNWKEFLKPTKAKLLVAAILFILFVPFIELRNFLMCDPVPCPPQVDTIALFSLLTAPFMLMGANPQINFLLDAALFGIIVSYLVACLLASIYSKYAKPKK